MANKETGQDFKQNYAADKQTPAQDILEAKWEKEHRGQEVPEIPKLYNKRGMLEKLIGAVDSMMTDKK